MRRRRHHARRSCESKAQLTARLVFDSDSVTNIAHQLGYYETIASVDLFTTAAGADRRGDDRRGRRGRARACSPPPTAPSAGSSRLPVGSKSVSASQAARVGRPDDDDASDFRRQTRRASHPTRTVLDNGAVSWPRRRTTTPAVTINLAVRAGFGRRSGRAAGHDVAAVARHRSRHGDAIGRRHRRRARQPRHHADDHRHAAPVLAGLHLPRRRLRAGARRCSATSSCRRRCRSRRSRPAKAK